MSVDVGLGPLHVTFTTTEVLFRLTDPGAMTLEMPAHLEQALLDLREEHAAEFSAKPVLVDLESLPAISSRQLGVLLTVRKVFEGAGLVTLRRVADPVRQLLEVTKIIKLFRLES